jgi:hypothetical protein
VQITGVGMPEGFDAYGFCTQIAVFTRVFMRKARVSQSSEEFSVLRKCVVPKNYPTDFEVKLKNEIAYSLTVAQHWSEDPLDGIPLKTLFQIPTLQTLCDGSFNRFMSLLGRFIASSAFEYRIENGLLFVPEPESPPLSDE